MIISPFPLFGLTIFPRAPNAFTPYYDVFLRLPQVVGHCLLLYNTSLPIPLYAAALQKLCIPDDAVDRRKLRSLLLIVRTVVKTSFETIIQLLRIVYRSCTAVFTIV